MSFIAKVIPIRPPRRCPLRGERLVCFKVKVCPFDWRPIEERARRAEADEKERREHALRA